MTDKREPVPTVLRWNAILEEQDGETLIVELELDTVVRDGNIPLLRFSRSMLRAIADTRGEDNTEDGSP